MTSDSSLYRQRSAALLAFLVIAVIDTSSSFAQRISGHLPGANLESIFPAGGQRGQTVTVQVRGRDLNLASELKFSHPGITSVPATTPLAKPDDPPIRRQGWFNVSIEPHVAPGVYEARCVGRYGLSTPRAFVVGVWPETTESGTNDSPQQAIDIQLDGVLNGLIERSGDIDYYRFSLAAGRRILVSCRAEAIDSLMEPTMTLFDESGRIVAESHETNHRDALIDFFAKTDGTYTVRIADLIHDGGPQQYYRLEVGSRPRIEFVFPPAAVRGTTGKHTVFGRILPGGMLTDQVMDDGIRLERVEVDIELPDRLTETARAETHLRQRVGNQVSPPSRGLEGIEYQLGEDAGWSNSVFVGSATATVMIEADNNDRAETAQRVAVPCEIAGQFYPRGDRDWNQFDAKKGDVWQIEVISQQLGLTTDPLLVIERLSADGVTSSEVAVVDDRQLEGYDRNVGGFENYGRFAFNTRTDDPAYRLVVPNDGTYRILIRDLHHTTRGDPRFVYRLSIRREQPDFRVVASPHFETDLGPNGRSCDPWAPVIRRGGIERIDLVALRYDGFDDAIRITVEGLPAGVTYEPTTLQPGQPTAPLVLHATAEAAAWHGRIQLMATSGTGDTEMRREIVSGIMVWPGQTQRVGGRSRTTGDVVLSVIEDEAPLVVHTGNDESTAWTAAPGDRLTIPIRLTRRAGFKGVVKIGGIGLPRGVVTAKTANFAANTDDGTMQLTVSASAKPGRYAFCFEAPITLDDPRVNAAAATAKSITMLVSSTPVIIDVRQKK